MSDIEYIVETELPIQVLHNLDLSKSNTTIDGVQFNYSVEKMKCHQNGSKCISCGIESNVIRVERNKNGHYIYGKNHLNVYAYTPAGHAILMTVDHAVLNSKGGTDTAENYNTMCIRCNTRRGNRYPNLQDFLDSMKGIDKVKYWSDWDKSVSQNAWERYWSVINKPARDAVRNGFLETSMHHHVGLYNRHHKKLKNELTATA
jgi:5-methylcytosine-specific restriction endonuclease McrA